VKDSGGCKIGNKEVKIIFNADYGIIIFEDENNLQRSCIDLSRRRKNITPVRNPVTHDNQRTKTNIATDYIVKVLIRL
jgi:hypothetical protein